MSVLTKMALGLTLVAAIGLMAVQVATAAPAALRVIGSGRSAGDFAVTSATGTKSRANAVYVRGYGKGLSSFAVVGCSKGLTSIGSKSTTLRSMVSGRLYRIKLPFLGGSCDVTASLSGRGSIRLQTLA